MWCRARAKAARPEICSALRPVIRPKVTVHTKRGTLRAETAETNLYASIDKASDKIARQLKNLKEREAHGGVHTHHRMPAKINEVPHSEELVDDTPLFARGVAELPAEPVRTKYFAIERVSRCLLYFATYYDRTPPLTGHPLGGRCPRLRLRRSWKIWITRGCFSGLRTRESCRCSIAGMPVVSAWSYRSQRRSTDR